LDAGAPDRELPEGTFIFPHFKVLEWVVEKLLEEEPHVVMVWKSRPW
jgi:hypothetical protein